MLLHQTLPRLGPFCIPMLPPPGNSQWKIPSAAAGPMANPLGTRRIQLQAPCSIPWKSHLESQLQLHLLIPSGIPAAASLANPILNPSCSLTCQSLWALWIPMCRWPCQCHCESLGAFFLFPIPSGIPAADPQCRCKSHSQSHGNPLASPCAHIPFGMLLGRPQMPL